MSLENLLKIGQLKPHPSEAAEIERLLIAARRNLRDAGVTSISPETRFDAAYKAKRALSINMIRALHNKLGISAEILIRPIRGPKIV